MFIQVQIIENIKAPCHWPLWGEFTSDQWIPWTQRASNVENVSIWWHHHTVLLVLGLCSWFDVLHFCACTHCEWCIWTPAPKLYAVWCCEHSSNNNHYSDVIMSAMTSQITSLKMVYSTVYSGADERKHQSSTSLAFVKEIPWWLLNSPNKGPVKRKMFPFEEVIMTSHYILILWLLVYYSLALNISILWNWYLLVHLP